MYQRFKPVRQWVLSVPKRLRPYLHHRPQTASAVLHILLRALQATLRKACPTAPKAAAMGAVSFLHRFGSSLNPHFHFHLIVVDGLFERVEDDTDPGSTHLEPHLRFHEANSLTHELLERLQDTIRKRVLRHMVRHGLLEPHEAIEADDLYQTVWKRILVRPEAYEGKGAFGAWLFRVATNACANEVRRESTIRTRLLRAFRIDRFRDHIWRPPLPDEAALSEERHEFLRRALAGVPPRQAEAVHLRYFEERTWREIAEIMGIKESTVRSLVSKGIQFVRDLEKEGEYGMP